MFFHWMYFDRNLYRYQSHMSVASIKANIGLINVQLSKKIKKRKSFANDGSS
jgi:hypothetical protein